VPGDVAGRGVAGGVELEVLSGVRVGVGRVRAGGGWLRVVAWVVVLGHGGVEEGGLGCVGEEEGGLAG
jgi:hypothetical protein